MQRYKIFSAGGCLAALLLVGAISLLGMGTAAAQTPSAVQGRAEIAPVFTRARVVSIEQQAQGKAFVRLKLLPRSKLPFTTQAFTVVDRALLEGIAEGAWVKFTARHVDGENTVTAMEVVEACPRFQHCD